MAALIYQNRPTKDIWNEDADSIAQTLYNAGYRKQSEVAREIFEEIKRGECKLSDFVSKIYLAELKKKYTEGKK